jgi:hypothetical protein
MEEGRVNAPLQQGLSWCEMVVQVDQSDDNRRLLE